VNLAHYVNELPDPIQAVVCRKIVENRAEQPVVKEAAQNCSQSDKTDKTTKHSQPPSSWDRYWQAPFKWQRLSEQTQVMNKLKSKSWQKPIAFSFNNQLNGHIYQSTDKRTAVLELDDYMQMQIIKRNHLGTVKALQNYCGQLRPRTLARGVLWSCDDWAALTFEGEVREIWRVLR